MKNARVIFALGAVVLSISACGGHVDGGSAEAPLPASQSAKGGASGAGGAGETAASPQGGATTSLPTNGGSGGVPPQANLNKLSFQTDVAPIFDHSCALAGCHSPESYVGLLLGPSKQFPASVVLPNIVSKVTYLDPIRPLVRPGAPDDSTLVRKLEGDFTGLGCEATKGCGQRMPPPSHAPLTQLEIAIVRQWIADGANE